MSVSAFIHPKHVNAFYGQNVVFFKRNELAVGIVIISIRSVKLIDVMANMPVEVLSLPFYS